MKILYHLLNRSDDETDETKEESDVVAVLDDTHFLQYVLQNLFF